jgi:hypothetical protein
VAVSDKPRALFPVLSLGEWGRSVVTALNWTLNGAPYPACVVADLPTSPDTGARGFVTNANATTFASVVAGGGSNKVPVYFDGTNWRIG